MSVRIFAALVLSALSFGLQAEALNESYAFALLGEPKYATDFSHFDYVNPAAPRAATCGGHRHLRQLQPLRHPRRARRAHDGTVRYAVHQLRRRTRQLLPADCRIGRFPADMSWMELDINARARFHDGSPITAADVAFTFSKFMTEGVPQFRSYYKGVTVKAISG